MGLPPGENNVTSCLANKTVQSASQMGQTPTRILVTYVMMYPVFGKYAANWGIGSEAVADNLTTCPVAVSKLIFGLLVLADTCGAVGEM